MSQILFISGIDTDAGKSYVTGWLARQMMNEGKRVITQKFIQTGNHEYSEDIDLHRRIMGTGYLPEDTDHTTAPIIYSYPASPQLAAELDRRPIDLGLIEQSTKKLTEKYDVVLIEGAGGLMVPLTDEYLTIDYPASHNLPIVLVTNGILGSINHTVLSLEAIKSHSLTLHSVVYNEAFDSKDKVIAADTRNFIRRYLQREFPATELRFCPKIELP